MSSRPQPPTAAHAATASSAAHASGRTGAAEPGMHRRVLGNGLELLVEPLRHAPVVALQAWVHVGGADENKARAAGLAHLHEHMLFKGTQTRGVGEVARTIEAVGGEMNAWTSFDETVYHLVLGREHGALGTELLADMVQRSIFDPDELAREIEVVLEEIRRAYDNPGRRVSHALFRTAYQSHAYRDPVLGSKESVAATKRADMLAFFHEHYRPDNTTMIVVGDVDVDEAEAWVQKSFGDWRAAPKVTAAESTRAERVPEPAPTAVRLSVLAEEVHEANVSVAFAGPAAKDERTAAADLFSVALGHGESGRLHQALVRSERVLGAYASCYTPKDPGLLLLGATLKGVTPSKADVLAAIDALFEQAFLLARTPPSAEELEKARTLILSDAAYSRETMEGQARKRGFYHGAAGSWQHEQRYLQQVESLSATDLCTEGRRLLSAPPAVVLQLPRVGTDEAQGITAADIEALWHKHRAGGAETRDEAPAERRPTRRPLPAAGALDVVKVKLPQGPTLLLQNKPGPVVSMRAIALGGQRLEEASQAGLGVLFANVWGQGSSSMSATELAARLAAQGGHVGAFGGRNSVGLSVEALAERAEDTLSLALDVLFSPAFAAGDVARERLAQAERIRTRQDSPGGVAIDLFLRTLFDAHPYGLPALGTAKTVAGLDPAALAAYHGRFLAPERLIVSVVGPVEPAAVADWVASAQARAGAGEPSTLEEALRLSQPLPAPAPQAALTSPRAARATLQKEQSHVLLGGVGTTVRHADRYPLAVLSAVLNGQSGRLFADLRDVQSLAYSLSCSSAEGLDPGHVMVHMASSPTKVERALEGVRGHLARLASEAVPAAEMDRARNMLIGGHAIDLQRAGARAMTHATGELYGLGYDHFQRYDEQIRAVRADDVQRVAHSYLAPERLCEVVVGADRQA